MPKQRDGPKVVVRLLVALLQSTLLDITLALIFLAVGALFFGPQDSNSLRKVAWVLVVAVMTLFFTGVVVIIKIILTLKDDSSDDD